MGEFGKNDVHITPKNASFGADQFSATMIKSVTDFV